LARAIACTLSSASTSPSLLPPPDDSGIVNLATADAAIANPDMAMPDPFRRSRFAGSRKPKRNILVGVPSARRLSPIDRPWRAIAPVRPGVALQSEFRYLCARLGLEVTITRLSSFQRDRPSLSSFSATQQSQLSVQITSSEYRVCSRRREACRQLSRRVNLARRINGNRNTSPDIAILRGG